MFRIAAIMLACIAAPAVAQAQRRMLQSEMTHLRSGEEREWSSFPEHASGNNLTVCFDAQANETPATLGLRRIDVKQGWQVKLNDKLLGRLFSDENDMDEVWVLAPGALRDGSNELLVEATGDRADDVLIGEVWLDPRPRDEVFSEARVQLIARDDEGNAIPCRFTILNEKGSLAAVGAESNDHLAVRSGVVYTSTGRADIGLASGNYTIVCGRGFEYSLDRVELITAPGDEKRHEFTLKRVVDTAGLVACDPHVHTFEISRHGDASLDERMITLAGEGIELPVATDHNIFVDYRPHLRRLGLANMITPIIGNEVTTKYGHFNVFPAVADAPLPDHQADSWEELFESIDVRETGSEYFFGVALESSRAKKRQSISLGRARGLSGSWPKPGGPNSISVALDGWTRSKRRIVFSVTRTAARASHAQPPHAANEPRPAAKKSPDTWYVL